MLQSTQLSKREWEVTNLLRVGNGNKQIAAALSISERTVEFHLKNIYKKFQVSSRVELILKLGSATGGPEAEKPGLSTVDNGGQIAENGDRLDSRKGWATALREAVYIIVKELRMESSLNTSSRNQENPTSFFEVIRV
ncbi:MAG: helix-turn-helix transcriptional regulator, partial [Anaerolineae bacterium]|nr:helix-turn-helix transcriptional regulator [Anaerolineae bacterium]